MVDPDAAWPPLPLSSWAETRDTLHMWTQVVGKIRLALSPPVNHWWHVTLLLTARGLTTTPMPYAGGFLEICFDFIDHRLDFDTGDGRRQSIALEPMTVADFYGKVRKALHDLEIAVHIWPLPSELSAPIRFDQDRTHRAYDAAWAERWWRVMALSDAILKEFRGRFLGKCSPVHFFWGGFDLAVSRFNGRRAPERPGADIIQREGYSHEVLSAGFWPGGSAGPVADAAFYAYAAPEPEGFKRARVKPAKAFYHQDLGEFILSYEDVRTSASPHDALMEFLQSTYEAGAALANWDRGALERR